MKTISTSSTPVSSEPTEAARLLSGVVPEILYAPEAWSLIRTLKTEYGVAVPDETTLRDLVQRMEGRTLIDEMYAAIRVGPYFRKQRLELALNPGVAYRKRPDRRSAARLSVLLADANGCRYPALLDSLTRQSLDREDYEVILCDVFDCESPRAMRIADTVMVCGQDEHLYNRNAAFNLALTEARGDLVVFCDGDGPLPETTLAEIAARADACATQRLALVNAGGTGRETIHTVVLDRDRAIASGGLDESAYYAGAHSGPYELVARLEGQRWTVAHLDVLPPRPNATAPQRTMAALFRDIWASKFSPYRAMPLRESADIAKLRRQAR